jgi:hypothetical protein
MSADEKVGTEGQTKAQEGGGGFTVTDRRIFADDKGTARVEEPAAPPHAEPDAAGGAPPVDFHTFVLSLGSSALLNLGELERPGSGGPQTDLPMAKHTIDILAMLQDKTKGNLLADEQRLLDSLLYDLRLRYVEATTKGAPQKK